MSEVARRHGITSQQLFGWRRSARGRAIERSDAPGFAAVMLEAPAEKAALDGAVLEILVGAIGRARSVDRRRRDAGEDRSRAEGSGMIVPSSGVKVLIAMKPVDFRKGMDGLAAVVHETLGANPFGGVIYVFRSKRADRVKLLFWDGTGLVLATKRVEQGSFRWPSLREGVMRLTPGRLVALLEGLDWARVRGARIPTPTAVRDWMLHFAGDSDDRS